MSLATPLVKSLDVVPVRLLLMTSESKSCVVDNCVSEYIKLLVAIDGG